MNWLDLEQDRVNYLRRKNGLPVTHTRPVQSSVNLWIFLCTLGLTLACTTL